MSIDSIKFGALTGSRPITTEAATRGRSGAEFGQIGKERISQFTQKPVDNNEQAALATLRGGHEVEDYEAAQKAADLFANAEYATNPINAVGNCAFEANNGFTNAKDGEVHPKYEQGLDYKNICLCA